MSHSLSEKITHRTAQVGVIGLGYVGLPLALACARAGFPTVGLEVNEQRAQDVNAAHSYIEDVSDVDLAPHVQAGRLRATTDYDVVRELDIIFICVPTPYTVQRAPDLVYIIKAAEGIATRLREGQLIVLQSTTYPGTTVEVVRPILEQASGLQAGHDFYLAFSPERIDPGNKQWSAYNTPKVVGGLTPESTALAAAFLRQTGAPVHEVSSPAAAELTKLLENTFRAVNIALVNEIALLAERMDIDFWEVLEAAKTKPFGFMPFSPGAGVGGHCIPIDPYYLLWKAREYDFYTRFIELAAETNETMPYHVVDLVVKGLSRQGKPLTGARVLVLGVAFKADIGDARNSPAERVIELLQGRGADVRYHDPYVPTYRVGGDVFQREPLTLHSVALTDAELAAADAVAIVTGHHDVDYARVLAHTSLVVDSCNVTHGLAGGATVIRLGAPLPQ
ncbi:MAG: UDP-N-acetyl-D-glucosamine dehydrogenase [Chloroflexi bacterium]|nr:MAG: UDP-N-acetyl-D-glucosamine dehydrogenase [Chloroflexota bacterium]